MEIDIRTRSKKASVSRRSFLQLAAFGTAALSPVVALAAVDDLTHLPPLSDQQQIDVCIAQLEQILERMRPGVIEQGHFLQVGRDGSYKLTLWSRVPKIEYDGDGFYHISEDGYPMLYRVERREQYTIAGRYFGDIFACEPWADGRPLGGVKRMSDPYFIRKLDGPHEISDALTASALHSFHGSTGEKEPC